MIKQYWDGFNGWQWSIYVLMGYTFVAAYPGGWLSSIFSTALIWWVSKFGYYAKESEIEIKESNET